MSDGLKKTILGVVAAGLIGYAAYAVWGTIGGGAEISKANTKGFKDSETGEVFQIKLEIGMKFPLENPKTGKNTLYPTEICYAGKCLKKGGTYVILNSTLGKDEPTYCPECGTIVVPRNPGPKYQDDDQ